MRRFAVQLLLPIAAVLAAFLLVAALYWSRAFERFYVEALTDRLEREGRVVAAELPWGQEGEALDRLCRLRGAELGARITVVGDDGRVLGESAEPSAGLENHAGRPEIVAARTAATGTAIRLSDTLHRPMLYVAIRDEVGRDHRFVRLALPLQALAESEHVIRRTLLYGFLAAMLLGGTAAWLISAGIARRVHRIESYSREIALEPESASGGIGGSELDKLERRLIDLARGMKRQLTAVEAERSRLEAVLRSMAEGVVVLDPEGRIDLCNESAIRLLDLSEPHTGAKLSTSCRNPDLIGVADEALRGDGAVAPREIALDGRGEVRTILASGARLSRDEGAPGAILVLHDVTRVRQLERMRADFVANVSHELRTPLTAIRGYTETLLGGAVEDRERTLQFLGVIDRHSKRLARLIDDLLSLSDLELGRTEIHPRPIVVASLVAAVLEILEPQAKARGIRLVADLPEDLPGMEGDRDRMEEVLINLVDNAIKYSAAGTTVTVRARTDSAGGGRPGIELAVVDQGIGIPEHEIPRLTERFFRVDKARSRELGGTGLGLAIVKHIVQAHGGSLAIESRVGVGTTVIVRIAAAKSAA